MQPQACVLVEGTVLGARVVQIPAMGAQYDANGNITREARDEGSYQELDVASKHARYDGKVLENVGAVTVVVYGKDDTLPNAGTVVQLLCVPYVKVVKTRAGSWSRFAAFRHVQPLSAGTANVPARAHAAA